jgi:hemoglobin
MGSTSETSTPSSGDPEADRRAELRVGSGTTSANANDTRPLYDRLGGRATIERLVDDMTDRVIADPRVNFERTDVKKSWIGTQVHEWSPTPTNVDHLKQHLVEFFVLATGGPSEYTGRDMKAVHSGMRITNPEFDAMVGDMKVSMDRLNLPHREKRELIAIVETTRKEIVEKQ